MQADGTGEAASQSRNDGIDVLRGLAILAVLLLHAGMMTEGIATKPALHVVFSRMSIGVQLFFVLSGYLVSQSLTHRMEVGEGVRGFLIRRAAKIVPLYMIFLHLHIAFYYASLALAPDVEPFRNSATGATLTWPNYFSHLLFLQGFAPATLHTLVDGSWSIVCEVYFYVLFALLICRWTKTALDTAWCYAASLGVAIVFVVFVGRHYSGYSHYAFLAQLPCFVLGVLAHRLNRTPGFETAFAPWHKAALAISLALMLGFLKGESKPLGDFHVYALCFMAALLAAPTVQTLMPATLARVLARWGRQCYALFFVHLLLLKTGYVVLEASHVHLPFFPALLLNLLIAVPLSWLASELIFDRIDRYFVGLAGRSLARRHPKPLDWSRA